MHVQNFSLVRGGGGGGRVANHVSRGWLDRYTKTWNLSRAGDKNVLKMYQKAWGRVGGWHIRIILENGWDIKDWLVKIGFPNPRAYKWYGLTWYHVCPVAWLKIANLCPCLSYFPGFFAVLKVELFFENEGTNLTPKQSNNMFSQFLESTTIK